MRYTYRYLFLIAILLQMLLSGNKNYQEYRDALVIRINMIIALEDENHFARGDFITLCHYID